jgi:hypothetical protein
MTTHATARSLTLVNDRKDGLKLSLCLDTSLLQIENGHVYISISKGMGLLLAEQIVPWATEQARDKYPPEPA